MSTYNSNTFLLFKFIKTLLFRYLTLFLTLNMNKYTHTFTLMYEAYTHTLTHAYIVEIEMSQHAFLHEILCIENEKYIFFALAFLELENDN